MVELVNQHAKPLVREETDLLRHMVELDQEELNQGYQELLALFVT